MKIAKVEINNFRSIKHLIVLPKQLCALIGPNSVGKTNILKAIDLVIGEGWTTKAKVARELFYDVSQDVEIKIFFEQAVSYPSGNDRVNSVNSIELTMSLNPELSVKTTINGGAPFYYQDNFKKLYHFIYLPADRQLSSELRVSNWTMLGKLMKLVHDNYISHFGDEATLKREFEEKIAPAKEFLESDFNLSDDVITFKNFTDIFIESCRSNSSGLANDFEPKLNIYNLNWFYKTLQINIKESFPDKVFDAEDVGAGMQNLILISIFQTYAKLMGGNVIFGIEEPEIFLYPQAQRSLYNTFIRLSEDSQIFYTTHNPNFVDAYRADEIEVLQKTNERGTFNLIKSGFVTREIAERYKFKIYTYFNTERNEIFFSRKVILVEGDSDKILWSTICTEKWMIDLDKKGVVIIECGGKGGVNYFIGVCKMMGIDYFAIWDRDNDNQNTEVNCLADALSDDRGFEIPENLELFLISKFPNSQFRENKKVEDAYNWSSNVEAGGIPGEFNAVKDFITRESDVENISDNVNEPQETQDDFSGENNVPF